MLRARRCCSVCGRRVLHFVEVYRDMLYEIECSDFPPLTVSHHIQRRQRRVGGIAFDCLPRQQRFPND